MVRRGDANHDSGVDVEASTLGSLLGEYRPRLRRMVQARLDPRLRGRLDASDVLQEAFVEVTERLDDYRASPKLPFFLWVRFLTGQKLLELHRRHLGAAKRDVRREAPGEAPFPEASSISLVGLLRSQGTSPSSAAMRAETAEHLRRALDRMNRVDREVLVLRHFEQLTNDETALVVGLSKSGASLRYLRAAKRLKEALAGELE